MLQPILEYTSWFFLLTGSFFCVVGGIGMHRFPDFYTRMHASGITDTLGAGLILIGLMFQEAMLPNASGLNIARIGLILVFLYLTSPTAAHALAKAAYNYGPKPLLGKIEKKGEGP